MELMRDLRFYTRTHLKLNLLRILLIAINYFFIISIFCHLSTITWLFYIDLFYCIHEYELYVECCFLLIEVQFYMHYKLVIFNTAVLGFPWAILQTNILLPRENSVERKHKFNCSVFSYLTKNVYSV